MKAPSVPTRALVAVLACVAMVSASCIDATTSPNAAHGPQAQADLLGTLSKTVGGLLSCKALPEYSTTQTVGKAGGTIIVGPHYLVIPKGALDHDVTITAFAPSEK